MDYTSIPACALNRFAGTVIIRLKMEEISDYCKPEVYPESGCHEVVHRSSGCEQCNRTRLINKWSACDKSVGEKCQPYRSSAARSSKNKFYLLTQY